MVYNKMYKYIIRKEGSVSNSINYRALIKNNNQVLFNIILLCRDAIIL